MHDVRRNGAMPSMVDTRPFVVGETIAATPGALARIEAAVHPLVAEDRAQFIRAATEDGAPIVLLDIPLLFETDAESALDATVVVTAPAAVQRARVLARPGMTEAQFEAIRARQMPDAEKRARSDYVVVTDTPEHARAQVRAIVDTIMAGLRDA